ncbi:SIR2 family protein [Candidatus Acetothermia bacterium]|nr:SIR2 family protein [Candidatus Acetothermia bacterium]MBI3643673.1 SIR2 family protein [Candidatus Acetothermia bacterium]
MAIPKDLQESIEQGQVIPFVGAGVSIAVKRKGLQKSLFPSWKQLLENACKELDANDKSVFANSIKSELHLPEPDLLLAAQRARQGLKGGLWAKFLKSQFDHSKDDVEDESLKLAKLVWELGSNLIIPTNYDRVLRWSCGDSANLAEWDIEAPAEQADALRNGAKKPTIWHLHGQIDNASDLILTPDGYKFLYPEKEGIEGVYKAALETLRSFLVSHSFVYRIQFTR